MARTARARNANPVMELFTSASSAADCFIDGNQVQPFAEIEARFDRLGAAVKDAPDHPGSEWDLDCWRALKGVATLAAGAPWSWRKHVAQILRDTLAMALRLSPEARQREVEGIPDHELPYHLRGE